MTFPMNESHQEPYAKPMARTPLPIDKMLALSRQVIAEERQVDRIAMGIVAVDIV